MDIIEMEIHMCIQNLGHKFPNSVVIGDKYKKKNCDDKSFKVVNVEEKCLKPYVELICEQTDSKITQFFNELENNFVKC